MYGYAAYARWGSTGRTERVGQGEMDVFRSVASALLISWWSLSYNDPRSSSSEERPCICHLAQRQPVRTEGWAGWLVAHGSELRS